MFDECLTKVRHSFNIRKRIMDYIRKIRKSVIYGNTGSKKPHMEMLECQLGIKREKKANIIDDSTFAKLFITRKWESVQQRKNVSPQEPLAEEVDLIDGPLMDSPFEEDMTEEEDIEMHGNLHEEIEDDEWDEEEEE